MYGMMTGRSPFNNQVLHDGVGSLGECGDHLKAFLGGYVLQELKVRHFPPAGGEERRGAAGEIARVERRPLVAQLPSIELDVLVGLVGDVVLKDLRGKVAHGGRDPLSEFVHLAADLQDRFGIVLALVVLVSEFEGGGFENATEDEGVGGCAEDERSVGVHEESVGDERVWFQRIGEDRVDQSLAGLSLIVGDVDDGLGMKLRLGEEDEVGVLFDGLKLFSEIGEVVGGVFDVEGEDGAGRTRVNERMVVGEERRHAVEPEQLASIEHRHIEIRDARSRSTPGAVSC